MTIKRLSPVLTLIINDADEAYAINTENGFPITNKNIGTIVREHWTFLDLKATYQLVPYEIITN